MYKKIQSFLFFISCNFTFSLMNEKVKLHKMKKQLGFSYIQNIANFEAFCSRNLLFLKGDINNFFFLVDCPENTTMYTTTSEEK